jgi:hypothetical protein
MLTGALALSCVRFRDIVEHKRPYRNPTTRRTSEWQMNERQLSGRGFESRSDG